MLSHEDKDKMKSLITDTVVLLCRNGLVPKLHGQFSIEGLIGITLENDDLMLVSINETLKGNLSYLAHSADQVNDAISSDSSTIDGSDWETSYSRTLKMKKRKTAATIPIKTTKTKKRKTSKHSINKGTSLKKATSDEAQTLNQYTPNILDKPLIVKEEVINEETQSLEDNEHDYDMSGDETKDFDEEEQSISDNEKALEEDYEDSHLNDPVNIENINSTPKKKIRPLKAICNLAFLNNQGLTNTDEKLPLVNTQHFPQSLPPTAAKEHPCRRCKVCRVTKGKRKETRYYCPDCPRAPGLCFEPCFRIYHTKNSIDSSNLSNKKLFTS